MNSSFSALVVDDGDAIARTVRMALEGSGWHVDAAGSGEEALDRSVSRSYDLMLLDLRLPGIQGIDVLRRVAHDHPRMKVVIMTAFGAPACALEAMKLGAADILRKPFDPNDLRAIVDSVMSRDTDPEKIDWQFADDLVAARGHIREQRIPAAVERARRAVALHPDRPDGYHLLGACHHLLGRLADAEKMYRLANTIDPDHGPSKRNLERLLFARGSRDLMDLG